MRDIGYIGIAGQSAGSASERDQRARENAVRNSDRASWRNLATTVTDGKPPTTVTDE